MKKYLAICVFIICGSFVCHADRYKIIYLNNPNLLINGAKVKVGDVFDDNAIIKWSMERQAMRVYNLDKKKQMMMVAYKITPQGNCVKDIITSNMHLSTRDALSQSADFDTKLKHTFQTRYDIMDEILIDSPIKLSKKKYFIASYNYDGTKYTKKLGIKKGKQIVIDLSLFDTDNANLKPHDINIDISYVDEKKSETKIVKSGVLIYFVPTEIHSSILTR